MPDLTFRDRLDAAGFAAAVVCCVFWGGNAVAVKYAVPDLPPLGCAAVRFAIGLPVVGVPQWTFHPRGLNASFTDKRSEKVWRNLFAILWLRPL